MAVAEFFRTDRGDHLGIAGRLRGTEGFEVLCNCILVRAGEGGNGAQEAKRKHRKGELAAIDLHGVSSSFDRVDSLAVGLQLVEHLVRPLKRLGSSQTVRTQYRGDSPIARLLQRIFAMSIAPPNVG